MDRLIQNFSIKSVADFFFSKINSFIRSTENIEIDLNETDFTKFSNLQKLGEATFNDATDLLVFACKYNGALSERSAKKRQFEIAKKVLKEDFKDGAIFIFYDDNGCFRFSFIRKNYGNKDQKFSNWKRYTYFVDPSRTNKTFKNRINGCNFNSLEDIQEAFSVEKLNKKFYEEIATAFYSLIGGKVSINKKEVSFDSCLQLPSTPKENRKVYQEFAVRLIGRTIFCWFLKNKKSDSGIPLIPEEWLSSKMVVSVNNDQHNYYHSILEKLFFLVLNKKQEERKPYILPNNHEFVPFLNGGLFEAQDDDFFKPDHKGIHQTNFALNIPNHWFIDFFTVLEQYNFTIDENSINDFEVSIDPEMLGTIFENLLAEIDPDTEKSARKSTGSFYTPREIVDYMVEQSLLQYIKTKTNIEEAKIEILLKDDSTDLTTFEKLSNLTFEKLSNLTFEKLSNLTFEKLSNLSEKQKIQILEALSDIKILDPACGSGAFPMGVLHKIIALLKKLDKGAVWWKAKQLEKIDNALVRKAMETKLDNANSDYIRKLGVIQHSIYGVDIQPIAAEISKLRSFLSLIIDENIDDKANNRGIEPLPNLEFKFVTANTLIGLEAEKQQTSFDFGQNEEILKELQKIRNEYLQASPNEKEAIKKRFRKVQDKINSTGNTNNLSARESQLYHWKPFSNDSSTWFDPEWMFGVEKFDIVIGNPPYGAKLENKKMYKEIFPRTSFGNIDSYKYFIDKGISLTKKQGVTCYITSDSFLEKEYYIDVRKLMLDECSSIYNVKLGDDVFENVNLPTAVFFAIINNLKSDTVLKTSDVSTSSVVSKISNINENAELIFISNDTNLGFLKSQKKIKKEGCIKLIDIYDQVMGVKVYQVGKGKPKQTSYEINTNCFISDEIKTEGNWKKYIDSGVKRYFFDGDNKFINYGEWLAEPRKMRYFENPKILIREIVNPRIFSCYVEEECIVKNTNCVIIEKSGNYSIKYLLGIINSVFFDYYIKDNSPKSSNKSFPSISSALIKNFPIVDIDIKNQQPFISIVNQILENKEQNLDTTDLEAKIDLMVYKLYELTYNEVKVVDPEFGLSEQEYDGYKI